MARALPFMTEINVDSTNIKSVWFNPTAYILRVTFLASKTQPERVYIYHGVTTPVFEALMNAASKGKYLARHIKGRYTYQQM